jgi:hypothetical protein
MALILQVCLQELASRVDITITSVEMLTLSLVNEGELA